MRRDHVPGVDGAAIRAWMSSLGISLAEPLRFERIGLGQSNLTYVVRDGQGRRWVLRRPPHGHLLASAHDVAREARVLGAIEGTDVPSPGVLGLHRAGDVPLLLMEHVDGLVVDRMSAARALPAPLRRAIGLSMVTALAKIHAVDLEATGLVDLASHKPYAHRQLRRWRAQWSNSKTRDLPELDALTARLLAAVPQHDELTLVHGDFHLRNVIISPDTGDIVAVLDWELCTLGDPLADLGLLLAYWPRDGEQTVDGFAAPTLDGFPDRDELTASYAELTGRDLSALGFWHALGLWKIAIVSEGVLRRISDEPRNKAESGTPTTAGIDGLLARANDVATACGI